MNKTTRQQAVRRPPLYYRVAIWLFDHSPLFRRKLVKIWYNYVSKRDGGTDIIFMNLGFHDADDVPLELEQVDETDRNCISLYHHVVENVNLKGLDVLEVGCGRGGGASYLRRYFAPRSVMAVDIAQSAVRFCRRRHPIDGLVFRRGDAERLQFEDNSFDVVVNVESSHSYGYIDRFFSEVHRVLRPGGYFLYADFRPENEVGDWHTIIDETPFVRKRSLLINSQIVAGMLLDEEKKQQMVKDFFPAWIQGAVAQFAGLRGTKVHHRLADGAYEYWSFTAQKVPTSQNDARKGIKGTK